MQGIICSGVSYYISGVLMKERGPVFVSAFNPLTMVIVAILSSFILAEQIFVGRYVRMNLLSLSLVSLATLLHNFLNFFVLI